MPSPRDPVRKGRIAPGCEWALVTKGRFRSRCTLFGAEGARHKFFNRALEGPAFYYDGSGILANTQRRFRCGAAASGAHSLNQGLLSPILRAVARLPGSVCL